MARRGIDTYKAVLLDGDDTVLATAKTRWGLMRKTARELFGSEPTEDEIQRCWGLPFEQMIRRLLPKVDFDEYVRAYREKMRRNPPDATPGVAALLGFLARRGIDVRIVSSGNRELLIQDLDALGLRRYLVEVYGHEQTRFHKPDKRVLDRPICDLEHAGIVRRSEMVYIGDSVQDCEPAAGQGIDFIGVASGLESPDDLVGAGVPREMIVGRLDELIPDA